MNKMENETLLWSYFDGDIDVKDRVEVDRLRASDKDFEKMFLEIKDVHEGLKSIGTEKLSPEFSKMMADRIVTQFAKSEQSSVQINPLLVFGICLAAVGMAFFYSSGSETTDYLIGLGLDYSFGSDKISLDGLPTDLHWSYFTIFAVAPFVYFIDQIMQRRLSLSQLPVL